MIQRSVEARGGIQNFREKLGLKASVLVLSGLAISSCTSEQPQVPKTAYTAANAVNDAATLDACPTPNQKAIANVETLFAGESAVEDYDTADTTQTYFEVRQELAESHGLTIYDYSEEMIKLKQDAYSEHPKLPVSAYIDGVNAFANKYGVEVVIGEKDVDFYNQDDTRLTDDELDQTLTKQSILAFVDAIGELPVEFVQHVGLNKVVLLSIHEEKDNLAVVGYTYPNLPGVIYIDPTAASDYEGVESIRKNYLHELFHQWDAKVCSSYDMDIDAGFDAMNPGAIYKYYETDANKHGTPGTFLSAKVVLDKVDDLEAAKFDAYKKGNKKEIAKLDAQIAKLKKRIVVSEGYGFSSIAEDKATMGELIFDPYSYVELFDKASPIFHKKATYLIARLNIDMPEMVQYFADITYRGKQ